MSTFILVVFSFPDWFNNISSALKTGDTAYFLNQKDSYYDLISSMWNKMTVDNKTVGFFY